VRVYWERLVEEAEGEAEGGSRVERKLSSGGVDGGFEGAGLKGSTSLVPEGGSVRQGSSGGIDWPTGREGVGGEERFVPSLCPALPQLDRVLKADTTLLPPSYPDSHAPVPFPLH